MALWSEKHCPSCEAELVVAKKKVQDVKEFLVSSSRERRVLVLRGPPGCGKAATLHGLCGDIGFEVLEWKPSLARRPGQDGEEGRVSLSVAFLRFLAQSDRYRSLDVGGTAPVRSGRPRVTLVRDFPFTLVSKRESGSSQDFLNRFWDLLSGEAVQRAVFCFNDESDDHRVVTEIFKKTPPQCTTTVNFDAMARTFAQRALTGVAKAEGIAGMVDTGAIAAECGGDLRQGINALQLTAGGSRERSFATRRLQKAVSGSSIGGEGLEFRPISLNLFHAVGKFMYNKRLLPSGALSQETSRKRRKDTAQEPQQLPPELMTPKSRRPQLYFVPEEVLDAANTEPAVVVDWLFTNAPRFYGDVSHLANFAETLSGVDSWGNDREGSIDGLAASVQARAVLDANLHPVPPTFGNSHEASSFNMVRPQLWDARRHKSRRLQALAATLEMIGPLALGPSSPALVLRTLPSVHMMLSLSRGQHAKLRSLPHCLMGQVMDLSSFDGTVSRTGKEEGDFARRAPEWTADTWVSLPDDPIED